MSILTTLCYFVTMHFEQNKPQHVYMFVPIVPSGAANQLPISWFNVSWWELQVHLQRVQDQWRHLVLWRVWGHIWEPGTWRTQRQPTPHWDREVREYFNITTELVYECVHHSSPHNKFTCSLMAGANFLCFLFCSKLLPYNYYLTTV